MGAAALVELALNLDRGFDRIWREAFKDLLKEKPGRWTHASRG
jgi:hypothetical protein